MKNPYGLVAEFASPDEVLEAARQAWEAGYRSMDAFTPFAVEGLSEAVGFPRTRVPLVTLLCGLAGGAGGYFMMWYSATISYPLNVGGRPLHSWPAFIPITFELAVLCAALGTVIGMLVLNGLPRPHHPIFNTPHYAERSGSRFYLCIKADDGLYDSESTWEFLRKTGASDIWEVPK
jgi:hypothetical protein